MAGGIPQIGGLQLPMVEGTEAAGTVKGTAGFGDVLRTKLDQLSEMQESGKAAAGELATGRVDDIAQTMLRVEQANVSLQMATQLRNKAVEAYQEILRMQI